MKHLKTYNESQDTKSERKLVIQELLDICLELNDDGFKTRLHQSQRNIADGSYNKEGFNMTIYKPSKKGNFLSTFGYKEVYEVINRIIDYMKMNGYSTKVVRNSDDVEIDNVFLKFTKI